MSCQETGVATCVVAKITDLFLSGKVRKVSLDPFRGFPSPAHHPTYAPLRARGE